MGKLDKVATSDEEHAASVNAPSANGACRSEWKHLSARPDSWRRQLYLNDRNMTVGQLVSTVRANGETPDQASDNMGLPVDAILEALEYYEQNKELIQAEAAAEREFLQSKGYKIEPRPVP